MRVYPVEEAVRAQKALREAAGLGPEMFPVQAFVGMISDEIEALRGRGMTDEAIAGLIESSSNIRITASEIAAHYASPGERRSAKRPDRGPGTARLGMAGDGGVV